MNAKHQFKYTYTDTDVEEISPLDITFDMPGDVNITQMLFNFECYLKACGFVFDGRLEMVKDGWDSFSDELDGTLYEFKDEELQDGCMADWDTEDEDSSCCDKKKDNKEDLKMWDRVAKTVEDKWNEDFAKLDNEIKTQRKIREMANKSADMVKDFNDAYTKLTEEQKMDAFKKACEMSDLHDEATKEVKKNKWVHGICNPPSADWKATNSQKEYVEDCKSTGKKYSSVQEMVDHLSNIKYKL
jgi:hypothetical protein